MHLHASPHVPVRPHASPCVLMLPMHPRASHTSLYIPLRPHVSLCSLHVPMLLAHPHVSPHVPACPHTSSPVPTQPLHRPALAESAPSSGARRGGFTVPVLQSPQLVDAAPPAGEAVDWSAPALSRWESSYTCRHESASQPCCELSWLLLQARRRLTAEHALATTLTPQVSSAISQITGRRVSSQGRAVDTDEPLASPASWDARWLEVAVTWAGDAVAGRRVSQGEATQHKVKREADALAAFCRAVLAKSRVARVSSA